MTVIQLRAKVIQLHAKVIQLRAKVLHGEPAEAPDPAADEQAAAIAAHVVAGPQAGSEIR